MGVVQFSRLKKDCAGGRFFSLVNMNLIIKSLRYFKSGLEENVLSCAFYIWYLTLRWTCKALHTVDSQWTEDEIVHIYIITSLVSSPSEYAAMRLS